MFTPPPSRAAEFRSDDLDEVHAFIARYDGNHRRTPMDAGALGYAMRAVRCGNIDAGWGSTRTRQKVRGVPRDAILQVPTGRRHVYEVDGRTLQAQPDTAVLLAPGREYTLFFEPHDCLVVMRVPGSALAYECAGRDPNAAAPGCVRELPLSHGRLEVLASMHRAIVRASDASPSNASVLARQLEARLCGWIADQVLGNRQGSPAPELAVQRVRSVEAWIDGHLADPITLGRLCAVAGVGDRHLQSAFLRHRGQSPLQFVAARRLASVRRRLLDAKPGDSVTQVAHDTGIVHLGRFAARYRASYRESPSATLRRRLRGWTD